MAIHFLSFKKDCNILTIESGTDFPQSTSMIGSARAVFDSVRMAVKHDDVIILGIRKDDGKDKTRTIAARNLRRTARYLS